MKRSLHIAGLFVGAMALSACDTQKSTDVALPTYATYSGSDIVIQHAQMRMVLTPTVSGRISSLKIANQEVLTDVGDKHRRWGNILWSSPQSEWGWPPPPTLDGEPYETEIDDDSIIFTSQVDPITQYQFTKRYRLLDDGIRITYSIKNLSKKKKQVAPLELTRVPGKGEVVFPMGDTPPMSGIFYPLKVKIEQGLCWFHYDASLMTSGDHYKITMDGSEGWLAYRLDNVILIKQFKDVSAQNVVPGEQEIELFAHNDKTFLELKHQGAQRNLSPGKSLSWSVIWRGYELPQNLRDKVAPEELADFVRKKIN